MLERGGYLPRSRDNWDAKTVFVDGKYQASETWYGKDGSAFHPGLHYYVGGNSKVYGAALFRLREQDFGELRHADGISPAWPLGYDVFEPYYCEAEALFHVHGAARRRSQRTLVQQALCLSASPPRAAHSGIERQPGEGRAASVSSAARHQAGSKPGRQRNDIQPLYPLRRL